MTSTDQHLEHDYRDGLTAYLDDPGEHQLERAYEFGRNALTSGLGLLEVVELHMRTVEPFITGGRHTTSTNDLMRRQGQFLRETLASYEVAHRGFKETADAVRQVLEFGMVLGHELRAPLTSVKASSGMLREQVEKYGDRGVRRLVDNVEAGAASIETRLHDLVELIGLRTGKLSIRRENVMPAHYFGALCVRLEPEVRMAGLELKTDIATDIPPVSMDPNRMEQVVINLVQNAVKYGRGGGSIEVKLSHQAEHLVFSVRDHGPGIAFWDASSLFQPFVRLGRDRHESTGFGVGLALCQTIVHGHGGQIELESEEGAGTNVWFVLPKTSANTSPAEDS